MKKILTILLLIGAVNCAAVATADAVSKTETVRALVHLAESKQYADKRIQQNGGVAPASQGDDSVSNWNNAGQSEYNSAQGVTYSGYTSGSGK